MEHLSYVVQQVRENCIVEYSQNNYVFKQSEENIEMLSQNKKLAYQGEVSERAKKVIEKRINVWYKAVHQQYLNTPVHKRKNARRLIFITLTLSDNQRHADKFIKQKMLRPFLRKLTERFNCKHYIWKAESQANGRIHFHIITDQYIPKESITYEWNKIQLSQSYLKNINETNQGKKPTSTFVKVMSDDRILANYLSKYISKSDSYRKIDGAVWKCSKSLLELSYYSYIADDEQNSRIDKGVNENKVVVLEDEQCKVILANSGSIFDYLTDYNKREHSMYYKFMYQYLYLDHSPLGWLKYYEENYNSSFKINMARIRRRIIERTVNEAEQLNLFTLNKQHYE